MTARACDADFCLSASEILRRSALLPCASRHFASADRRTSASLASAAAAAASARAPAAAVAALASSAARLAPSSSASARAIATCRDTAEVQVRCCDEEVAWTTSLAAAGGAFSFWDHDGVD